MTRWAVEGVRVWDPAAGSFIAEPVPEFFVDAPSETAARALARLIVTGTSAVKREVGGRGGIVVGFNAHTSRLVPGGLDRASILLSALDAATDGELADLRTDLAWSAPEDREAKTEKVRRWLKSIGADR